MYDHKNKVKCKGGFTVEILQINPPGIDIKATDDYSTLRTLYSLEF